MDKKIQSLYEKITDTLTPDFLKEKSAGLISAYRKKDYKTLFNYASRILDEKSLADLSLDQVFIHTIKNYHPDRHRRMMIEIENSLKDQNITILEQYARLLQLPGYSVHTKTSFKKYDFVYEEIYAFKEADTSHLYDDIDDDLESSVHFEENNHFDYSTKENYTFEEAVHDLYLGNIPRHEIHIEPDDFLDFDELQLADSGIVLLTGLEFCQNLTILDLSYNEITEIDEIAYCENITILDLSCNKIFEIKPLKSLKDLISLNLSNNNIESIDALTGHEQIIDLDISGNAIEDFTPLLTMKNLQTIRLENNPCLDDTVISQLAAKGVIMLH